MAGSIGRKCWAIAEGYIPEGPSGVGRAFESHETACIFNSGRDPAHVTITVFFSDRDPAGPYSLTVQGRRTAHVRFNDLKDPEPIPRATDYSSLIESDVPIVVQHTRLDSRRSDLSLLSTIAFPGND